MEGNTLKYIFEADASALTATFKSVVGNVKNLVSNMNSQSVDWVSILTGTLDPAIIASIASAFGIAIEQSLQFQDYMSQVGGTANAGAIQAAGGIQGTANVIQNLVSTTGQGMGDMAQAFTMVSGTITDTAAAVKFLQDASALSYQTHVPFLQLVQELVPLMQMYGVTTVPQVTQAMEGLSGALTQGAVSNINTLISTIVGAGPGIAQAGGNIADTAISFEKLTTIMSTPLATTWLDKIGTAAGNSLDQMNLVLLGGLDKTKKDIKNGGIEEAFNDVWKNVNKDSELQLTALSSNLGIPITALTAFKNVTKAQMQEMTLDVQNFQKTMQPLLPEDTKNMSDLQLLGSIWHKLMADLSEIPSGGFGDWFHGILEDIDKFLSSPWDTMKKDIQSLTLGGAQNAIGSVVNAVAGGPTGIATNAISGNIESGLSSIFSQFETSLSGLFGKNSAIDSNTAAQTTTPAGGQATGGVTSHTVVNNFNLGANAVGGAVTKSQDMLSKATYVNSFL